MYRPADSDAPRYVEAVRRMRTVAHPALLGDAEAIASIVSNDLAAVPPEVLGWALISAAAAAAHVDAPRLFEGQPPVRLAALMYAGEVLVTRAEAEDAADRFTQRANGRHEAAS
ncbi:MAG: hypothetical protein LC640_09460 [Frankia sp.]|nr:hypothetical protein [Frankia sp.]